VAVLTAERISIEEFSMGDKNRPFLQTSFWMKQKESFGWKGEAVRWKRGDLKGEILILIRTFFAGLSLAYVPGGPADFEGEDREIFLVELSQELRGILPLGCFILRYDLPEYSIGETPAAGYTHSLQKAPMDIQPPDTVVLDLTPGYETLLAGMHKKTRYNIRLASKKGVEVKEEGIEKLKDWYRLYQVTAERDKIAIHPFSYYQRLFELISRESSSVIKIYMAYSDGDLLAGIIVLFHETEATYLYGASSNEKRNLMPSYGLQSEAIQEACRRGCLSYDLFGIPPVDDPEHPMSGLYRFKTGFGGEIRHRPGAWDYPYSRLFYFLYVVMEKLRRFYFKKWKKR